MNVFSENEWSPLKSIIVGNTFDLENCKMEIDLSFKLFFSDNSFHYYGKDIYNKTIANTQYVQELTEDIEGLVGVLEREGVTVYRPKKMSNIHTVKTPYWKSTVMPALNVRDQLLVLGDTIIETAPLMRNRYFENDQMKHIFYEAFQDGANYISMPKPMMTDNSFDRSYYDSVSDDVLPAQVSDFDAGFEMMIDGANFVRFGSDIIVNVANQNHKIAVEWFRRNFPDYTFHEIFSLCNNHLDSYIVPLCEGTVLVRDKRFTDIMPDFLRSWDIIYSPEPQKNTFPAYDSQDIHLASPYIDINVLSIGNNKIITNSLFPELNAVLSEKGFDVIPVQHRHRRIFGGGWHCFTLDLERQ